MTLEHQVVSLPLAQKLKELGVEKKSFLYWCKHREVGWSLGYEESPGFYACYPIDGMGEREPFSGYGREHHHDTDGEVYSAFTVAELGEMLPDRIRKKNDRGWDGLQIWKHNGYFNIEYHETFDPPNVRIMADGVSEADARAKMLIYLLENKLIEL